MADSATPQRLCQYLAGYLAILWICIQLALWIAPRTQSTSWLTSAPPVILGGFVVAALSATLLRKQGSQI